MATYIVADVIWVTPCVNVQPMALARIQVVNICFHQNLVLFSLDEADCACDSRPISERVKVANGSNRMLERFAFKLLLSFLEKLNGITSS